MTCPTDIASHLEQLHNDSAVEKARQFNGPSERFCLECGEEIPERRRALGNVTLCFDCKTLEEEQQQRNS